MVVSKDAQILRDCFLRKHLRSALNNPFGDRLKSTFQKKPPWYNRPWSQDVSISDLIPWRYDKEWNTCFELMNIPSLIFPGEDLKDEYLFVIFNSNGDEIKRISSILEPFKTKQMVFSDILQDKRGYGTFASFHHAPGLKQTLLNGSYFIDRQYVGYKRKNEPLWSFAHGNVAALTHRPGAIKFGCLTTKPRKFATYRPQIAFYDCDKFELVYANPTLRKVFITIKFLDHDRNEIKSIKTSIPPAGIEIFEYKNLRRECFSIEHSGTIEFWRPIVFKYYKTHFDVLHS